METPLGRVPDNLPVAEDDRARVRSSEVRAVAITAFKSQLARDIGDSAPMPSDDEIGIMVDNLTESLLLLLRLRRDRLAREPQGEQ